MPKIIRCDAANVGLDELADLLLERHLAEQLTDARFERGVGSQGGRLLGPQGGVDARGCAGKAGSAAQAAPDNNGTRPKTIFNPSRMHLSSMETPTVRVFEAAFWGEDHTAMTALSNKGHSLCWSNQEVPNSSDAASGLQAKRAVDSVQSFTDLPDLLLVERTRGRDTRAFETLMRRYNRRLYRIARSILSNDDMAEEAVRAAYIRAFANLDRYEPAGKFGAWLARLAFNEALTLRRHSAGTAAAYAGARRAGPHLPLKALTPLPAGSNSKPRSMLCRKFSARCSCCASWKTSAELRLLCASD